MMKYNNNICIWGLLLLATLSQFSSNYAVLSQKTEKVETACAKTLETVMDLILIRIGPKLSQIALPDIDTSGMKMYSLTITGLDSITRDCDLSFILPEETKKLTIKLCVNVGEVILMGMARVNMMGMKLDNVIKITLDDVKLLINATAPLKDGGPVIVNKFEIVDIRKVNVDTQGVLSAFGGVINTLIKTKVKEMILKILNKKLPSILNEQLKKYPI